MTSNCSTFDYTCSTLPKILNKQNHKIKQFLCVIYYVKQLKSREKTQEKNTQKLSTSTLFHFSFQCKLGISVVCHADRLIKSFEMLDFVPSRMASALLKLSHSSPSPTSTGQSIAFSPSPLPTSSSPSPATTTPSYFSAPWSDVLYLGSSCR